MIVKNVVDVPPGVIELKDVRLPDGLVKKTNQKVWNYTCRVCDDGTYDGCDQIKTDEFFKEFEN